MLKFIFSHTRRDIYVKYMIPQKFLSITRGSLNECIGCFPTHNILISELALSIKPTRINFCIVVANRFWLATVPTSGKELQQRHIDRRHPHTMIHAASSLTTIGESIVPRVAKGLAMEGYIVALGKVLLIVI